MSSAVETSAVEAVSEEASPPSAVTSSMSAGPSWSRRGWVGALVALSWEGRGVELGRVERRALVETSLVNAAALLAASFAAAAADFLSPVLGLLFPASVLGLGTMVVGPLWLGWVGESWGQAGGDWAGEALRRRLLLVSLGLGLGSGLWLSGRWLALRTPPLWVLPLCRAVLVGVAPRAVLWDRPSILLWTVGVGVWAQIALGRAVGATDGGWELWTVAQLGLSFLSAQWELGTLAEGRYRAWLHSLVFVGASVWTQHLLTLSLAVPHATPCFVPKFSERDLIAATKRVLCQALRQD